jgi:ABC-type Co2+ transport system permease subunit
MGIFLMVTAALVMVPVALQLRAGDYKLRHIWAYVLFALGLFAIGAANEFLVDGDRRTAIGAGFAAMLIGLIAGELGSKTARRY